MARLYNDPKASPMDAPLESSSQGDVKDYLEKVSKLVPSEVIAGYVAMIGFVPLVQETELKSITYWIIFIFCLVLTPVYLNYHAEEGQPKYAHLALSTIAFIIWAYTTTGSSIVPQYYDAAIGSIVLIAFSLLSGMIPLKS